MLATAVGKTYYKCPNRSCNFVSWGKPYHRKCPRCLNPFLVESADPSGQKLLKCPRATCGYSLKYSNRPDEALEGADHPGFQKEFPARKPRRALVRRRIVRRKR
jgi:hypothetical protein